MTHKKDGILQDEYAHTLHRIVRGNDRRTYFPYQCVAGRDHRYYIKGVIHKLRIQDEVGRLY